MFRCRFIFVAVLLMSANALAVPLLLDNFESYLTGPLNTVASPPWTELANGGNATAAVIGGGGGGKYLTVTAAVGNPLLADPTNAAYRGIPAIPNANTATTLFARFRPETITTNSSFGISKLAVPTLGFGDFQVQMRAVATAGVVNFSVRGAGGVPANWTANYALTVGNWYNVWAVINQSTDRYDVYLTTGNNGADIVGNRLYTVLGNAFRTAALTEDLITLLGLSQGSKLTPNNNQLSFDDIYLTPGTDLTFVPEPATLVLLGLGSLALLRRRKS